MSGLISMAELESRLRDNPKSLLFAHLADHYLTEGRVDDALQLCHEGLKHHPDYVSGYFIQAKAYMAKDDLDQAEQSLKTLLSHDRQFLSAHKLLGDLMAREGWENKALIHYRDMLRLDALDLEVWALYKGLTDVDEDIFEEPATHSLSEDALDFNAPLLLSDEEEWQEDLTSPEEDESLFLELPEGRQADELPGEPEELIKVIEDSETLTEADVLEALETPTPFISSDDEDQASPVQSIEGALDAMDWPAELKAEESDQTETAEDKSTLQETDFAALMEKPVAAAPEKQEKPFSLDPSLDLASVVINDEDGELTFGDILPGESFEDSNLVSDNETDEADSSQDKIDAFDKLIDSMDWPEDETTDSEALPLIAENDTNDALQSDSLPEQLIAEDDAAETESRPWPGDEPQSAEESSAQNETPAIETDVDLSGFHESEAAAQASDEDIIWPDGSTSVDGDAAPSEEDLEIPMLTSDESGDDAAEQLDSEPQETASIPASDDSLSFSEDVSLEIPADSGLIGDTPESPALEADLSEDSDNSLDDLSIPEDDSATVEEAASDEANMTGQSSEDDDEAMSIDDILNAMQWPEGAAPDTQMDNESPEEESVTFEVPEETELDDLSVNADDSEEIGETVSDAETGPMEAAAPEETDDSSESGPESISMDDFLSSMQWPAGVDPNINGSDSSTDELLAETSELAEEQAGTVEAETGTETASVSEAAELTDMPPIPTAEIFKESDFELDDDNPPFKVNALFSNEPETGAAEAPSASNALFHEQDEEAPAEEENSESQGPAIVSPTLGEIYSAQGQFDKAIKVYQTLLEKDPGNETYRQKIEMIRKQMTQE